MLLKKIISTVCCLSLILLSLTSCKEVEEGPKVREPETQYTIYWDLFDTKSVIYSYKGDSRRSSNPTTRPSPLCLPNTTSCSISTTNIPASITSRPSTTRRASPL